VHLQVRCRGAEGWSYSIVPRVAPPRRFPARTARSRGPSGASGLGFLQRRVTRKHQAGGAASQAALPWHPGTGLGYKNKRAEIAAIDCFYSFFSRFITIAGGVSQWLLYIFLIQVGTKR